MFDFIKNKIHQHQRTRLSNKCHEGQLKDLLSSPPPSFNDNIANTEFLVADLEMTGLDPSQDKILSFGFTVIKNKGIQHSSAQHEMVSLANPDLTGSAPIHRIFNQDLVHGIAPKQALDHFLTQLENRVLVLHHAGLDKKFLDANCQKYHGASLNCLIVDTMQLEMKRRRRQGKVLHHLDLANARKRYGLPYYTQHNAAVDALATAELFLAQLSRLDPHDNLSLDAIL